MKKTCISLYLLALSLVATLLVSCGGRNNSVIDLSGDWRVTIDSLGIDTLIFLPSTLDMAGIGVPNNLPAELEKPQLLHLTREVEYIGPATYTRRIDIPDHIAGKPLSLKLERVMWRSALCVDGRQVGEFQESLTTPHEFVIPGLDAGEHELSLTIDNSRQHDISVDNLAHSYTNDTQTMWNGV